MLTKQDKQYLEEKFPTKAYLAENYYDKPYLDEQFRGVAWEFERVHERINTLEDKMDAGFAAIDTQFAKIDARFDQLEAKLDVKFSEISEFMQASNKRLIMLENHCFLS